MPQDYRPLPWNLPDQTDWSDWHEPRYRNAPGLLQLASDAAGRAGLDATSTPLGNPLSARQFDPQPVLAPPIAAVSPGEVRGAGPDLPVMPLGSVRGGGPPLTDGSGLLPQSLGVGQVAAFVPASQRPMQHTVSPEEAARWTAQGMPLAGPSRQDVSNATLGSQMANSALGSLLPTVQPPGSSNPLSGTMPLGPAPMPEGVPHFGPGRVDAVRRDREFMGPTLGGVFLNSGPQGSTYQYGPGDTRQFHPEGFQIGGVGTDFRDPRVTNTLAGQHASMLEGLLGRLTDRNRPGDPLDPAVIQSALQAQQGIYHGLLPASMRHAADVGRLNLDEIVKLGGRGLPGEMQLNAARDLGINGTPGAISNAARDTESRRILAENSRTGEDVAADQQAELQIRDMMARRGFTNEAYALAELRRQNPAFRAPRRLGGPGGAGGHSLVRDTNGNVVSTPAPGPLSGFAPMNATGTPAEQQVRLTQSRNALGALLASVNADHIPTTTTAGVTSRNTYEQSPDAYHRAITRAMEAVPEDYIRGDTQHFMQQMRQLGGENGLNGWLQQSNQPILNILSPERARQQRAIQRYLRMAGMNQTPIGVNSAGATGIERVFNAPGNLGRAALQLFGLGGE